MIENGLQKLTKPRLVVGITGASGAILGIRLLETLQKINVETHLVLSSAAQRTIEQETDWQIAGVRALAQYIYGVNEIGAAIASGSFPTAGMIVMPCSIKTLSAIANSYSSDLLSRAADVTLKEGRPLILVVRETPFHLGHLHIMELAAQAGAVIFPPIPAFYTRPKSLNEIIDQFIGRVLARIGLENDFYQQWDGGKEIE